MNETAAQRILRICGLNRASLADVLDMDPEHVEAFISEDHVAEAGRDYEPDGGMPLVFARDLALILGVHRACLDEPVADDEDDRYPIIMNIRDNDNVDIDGVFGRLAMSLPPRPGFPAGTAFSYPILQSTMEDWAMPVPGEPIASITNGFSAVIAFPEGANHFVTEAIDANATPDAALFRSSDPLEGINPELCLGALELFMIAGDGEILNKELRNTQPDNMSPRYVTAIQNFIADMGVDLVRDILSVVEVVMRDGAVRNIRIPLDHSVMLEGFYRICRGSRKPPFFLLADTGRLVGIPMDRIAAIRFPWPSIARYGAQIDMHMDEDTDPATHDPRDESDLLHLTDDMLPGKKKKIS